MMIRLILLMFIFGILFFDPYFLQNSLADHQLQKSKEESLIVHKNRTGELRNHPLWKNFKNEIVEKANSLKVIKDN